MPVVSPLLALIAAALFAVSATVQQDAARLSALARPPSTLDGRREWLPVLGIFGRLLRNPRWLVGWLLNVLGFVAHAAALYLGTIAAVQVILVIQLMFVLLLRAAGRGARPSRRDWLAAAAVCTGVATLVLLRGDVGQSVPPGGSVLAFVVVAAALVLILLGLTRRWVGRRPARTSMVAVGAGLCFCVTAVLVVVVTHDLATAGPLGAVGWPLFGLIGSAVAGSLLVQDSFAAGSLPVALTAMTITDPVASSVAGALLFDAAPPSGLELSLGLPAAGVLIVVGVALLANSPTLHDERHHTRAAMVSV